MTTHGCCTAARDETDALARRAEAVTRRGQPVRRSWSDVISGQFRIGTDRPARFPDDGEGPSRVVRLSPFRIACHAVTNAEFGDFVRETGFTTDAERFNWSFVFEGHLPAAQRQQHARRPHDAPWWVALPRAYWAQPEGPGSDILTRLDHPVVHISWNDARAYCDWAGTMLPTEAQWEASARGGLDGALYPWGDKLTPRGEHRCNIWQGQFPQADRAADGFAGTCPVNAFAPNGFGLFNMVGNVWEWCADAFSRDYHASTERDDPVDLRDQPSRSLRGGSFLCHASYCDRYRVAARTANTRDSSSSNIGFRVATFAT